MKNVIKFFFIFIYASSFYGQQVNNVEFKNKTLQVFQNLDKNRIPHKILLDFGMEFTNVQAFNGTLTDSTYTNSQTLSEIYKTLLMCRAKDISNGFITPQEYSTRWYSQRAKGVIVLSGLYFKYNKFIDNAYPSKLNYVNNQFSDKFIGSVWQNPYEEKQLFAMTSSVTKYRGLNFNVKLPSNLFLSNYLTTVQSIQIDFSDGLGYRNIGYNQLVSVNYLQPNTYTWKYKITLTNGQVLLSHSKIQVENGLNAIDLNQSAMLSQSMTSQAITQPPANLSQYYKTTITATVPYLGYYGSATVYIKYASGTTLTKPLIVAEGFDTGIILNPEQEAGDGNVEDFLFKINNSSSNLPLEINSYDIVYVDWNNGVDFIQRNAYVLEEVIKWVNQNKTGNQQNVVLGQSMGGLVARYALRDIELNRNFNHDTRLYISHDAPHLGANTPLSIQYSARHLRNMYINSPTPLIAGEVIVPLIYNFAEGFSQIINFFGGNTSVTGTITPLQGFSLADVPAARQMQYNWINIDYQNNNIIHGAWQTELSQLGYPVGYVNKPIRNIAIANGSECGTIQTDHGNIMSYIKDAGRGTFLSNYVSLLDAVYADLINRPDIAIVSTLFPGKSYWEIDFQSKYMTTLNQNKNIYHGSIKYKKKVFWFIPMSVTVTELDINQPYNVLPYDIYGGGWQKTSSNQLPISGITSNSFGFIPTASALDIGKGTTIINDSDYRNSFIGALPPSLPKNSPFQNFVTHFDQFNPTNNNSNHISFNRRNGNWLRSELNVSIVDEYTNCSYICQGSQISGGDTLCSTGSYSVPSGATFYNWSITEGSDLVTFIGNGTSNIALTNSNNGNGFVTIQASYGDLDARCGNVTKTKTIWVGLPEFNGFTFGNTGSQQSLCIYPINNYSYSIPELNSTDEIIANFNGLTSSDLSNNTNWEWQTMNGVIMINGSKNKRYVCPMSGGATSVSVRAKNTCGWSDWFELPFVLTELPPNMLRQNQTIYSIYPNPSRDIVTIELRDKNNKPDKGSTVHGELFDLIGLSRSKVQIQDNKATFSVQGLNKGIYLLKIYINDQVESHQIAVE